jgi:hypothetical protein
VVVWRFEGYKRVLRAGIGTAPPLKTVAYRASIARAKPISYLITGPSPRRAFWGASAQARGTDDPAALCPVLNVEALRCTGGPGIDQVQMAEA